MQPGEICCYEERLKRYQRIMAGFGFNGETGLKVVPLVASYRPLLRA